VGDYAGFQVPTATRQIPIYITIYSIDAAMAMKFELQENLGKYPIVSRSAAARTSAWYLRARPVRRPRRRHQGVPVRQTSIRRPAHDAQGVPPEAALAGKLSHPHIVVGLDAVCRAEHKATWSWRRARTRLEATPSHTCAAQQSRRSSSSACAPRVRVPARGDPPRHQAGKHPASQSGDTKVSDFGPRSSSATARRRRRYRVGSPAYMSPEQIPDGRHHAPDRYLFAGRGDVRMLPAGCPTRPTPSGTQLRHSQLGPGPAGDFASGLSPLARPDRHEGDREDPAAGTRPGSSSQGAQPGFTTLRLSGASVSDSEKFNDLRDMPFFEDFDDVPWGGQCIAAGEDLPRTVIIREAAQ